MKLLGITLLIMANFAVGLGVVHQQYLSRQWLRAINEERERAEILQREYAQLHGQYSTSRGDLEDQMIARNRLGMVSPKIERNTIVLPNPLHPLSETRP